jgi:hypothetical protein
MGEVIAMIWEMTDCRGIDGSDMRILNLLSGVAVLLTTLAFGHLWHRYFVDAPHESLRDTGFVAGMITGVTVGIFSFIGGCFLVRRAR